MSVATATRYRLAARHPSRRAGWPVIINMLTTPAIYSLAVPLALLDVWVTAYQWICFPVYGVDCVPRRPYFVIDRHRLPYLSLFAKANCLYCSYATGLIAYVREVTARTEQYWCPIRHARRVRGAHARYRAFTAYGDADAYQRRLPALRRALRGRHGGHRVAR